MAEPAFVGIGDWCADLYNPAATQITVTPPPGAAVGDRLIIYVQASYTLGGGAGVAFTAPGFDQIGVGSFGAVPPSSVRVTRLVELVGTYTGGTVTVTATWSSPTFLTRWACIAAAYRPRYSAGDTDGDGTSNAAATVPDTATAVTMRGPGTVVAAAACSVTPPGALTVPEGFTERYRDSGPVFTAPDPPAFVGAEIHLGAATNPTSLTISAPPAGTENGDTLLLAVFASFAAIGDEGFAISSVPGFDLHPGGGSGPGGSGNYDWLYRTFHRTSVMSPTRFPFTITPTVRPVGGTASWFAMLITYRGPSIPGPVNTDNAPVAATLAPDFDPWRGYNVAPYSTRVAILTTSSGFGSLPGSGGPNGDPFLGRNPIESDHIERFSVSNIPGRWGAIAVLDVQNDVNATSSFLAPVYDKQTGSPAGFSTFELARESAFRAGGIVIADRVLPGAADGDIINSPRWARSGSTNNGVSVLTAYDIAELDPLRRSRRGLGLVRG